MLLAVLFIVLVPIMIVSLVFIPLVIILVPSPFILLSVVVYIRMCLSIILRALLVTVEVWKLVELSGNCG